MPCSVFHFWRNAYCPGIAWKNDIFAFKMTRHSIFKISAWIHQKCSLIYILAFQFFIFFTYIFHHITSIYNFQKRKIRTRSLSVPSICRFWWKLTGFIWKTVLLTTVPALTHFWPKSAEYVTPPWRSLRPTYQGLENSSGQDVRNWPRKACAKFGDDIDKWRELFTFPQPEHG